MSRRRSTSEGGHADDFSFGFGHHDTYTVFATRRDEGGQRRMKRS
jgi:hypothetical protein